MKLRTSLYAMLLPIFTATGLFAGTIDLSPARPMDEVPLPKEPSLSDHYAEYFSALEYYSSKALSLRQDSPEYIEASSYGMYLRARVEEFKRVGTRAASAALPDKYMPGFSKSVRAELDAIFGDGRRADAPKEPEVIKPAYCKIVYVKNNVPFLVQQDGFLKQGEVILTFDDGPDPLTHTVSAAMKAGGAPSLFFVLGRALTAAGKSQLATLDRDGHQVAVHGYNHATENDKPFTGYAAEKILSDLGMVVGTIESAVGKKPRFFRPPYGIIRAGDLRRVSAELELVPVGWTIDTMDWSTEDPEALFRNTTDMIKKRGKGIVLMHDVHSHSRAAAARLVTWLNENGYKVVSPDRLIEAYEAK